MSSDTSSSISSSSSSESSESSDDSVSEALLLFLGYNIYTTRESKVKNPFVDRSKAWEFVLSWDDHMFFRQFRFSKNNFNDLSFKLKNNFPGILFISINYYYY